MQKIAMDRISEFYSAMAAERALYLPLKKRGAVNFGRWQEVADVDIDALHTVKSPKDLFFPQSEDIVAFKMKGK